MILGIQGLHREINHFGTDFGGKLSSNDAPETDYNINLLQCYGAIDNRFSRTS